MDQLLEKQEKLITVADSSKQKFENRREYVRVYYPSDCSSTLLPKFVLCSQAFKVLDISQQGIRFSVPNSDLINDGMLSATIKFPDKVSFEITGEVVRRQQNQIALKLVKGIPFCRIMSEQLRLRNVENNGVIYNT